MLSASVALAACGSGDGDGNPASELTLEEATAALPEGAPPQLVAIRDEANELLDGGEDAFTERLETLRGTPVVVNKWASWCFPCRAEFPHFQTLATERGTRSPSSGSTATTPNRMPRTSWAGYLCPTRPTSTRASTSPSCWAAPRRRSRRPRSTTATGELVHTKFGEYKSLEELERDISEYLGV